MSDAAERLFRILGHPPEDDPHWPMVRLTLVETGKLLPTLYCQRSDASWLLEAVIELQAGSPASVPGAKTQPRHGIITDYPVFSALVAQPVDSADGEHRLTVRRLQALYLLAMADREPHIQEPRYRS